MANFTVNSINITTFYNPIINKWMAKVYDDETCHYKARRLRQGTYPFHNGIMVKVDYGSIKDGQPRDVYPPSISFFSPCQIDRSSQGFCEDGLV